MGSKGTGSDGRRPKAGCDRKKDSVGNQNLLLQDALQVNRQLFREIIRLLIHGFLAIYTKCSARRWLSPKPLLLAVGLAQMPRPFSPAFNELTNFLSLEGNFSIAALRPMA